LRKRAAHTSDPAKKRKPPSGADPCSFGAALIRGARLAAVSLAFSATLCAQDGAQPPPATEDPALPSADDPSPGAADAEAQEQPAAPPADPEPSARERWEEQQGSARTAAAAATAATEAPAEAPRGEPSDAARSYGGLLAQLLIMERNVNKYELGVLHERPLNKLSPEQRKRRLRSDADAEKLVRWVDELPLKGRFIPTRAEGRELSALESLVLARLDRAYSQSRQDTRQVTKLIDDDGKFMNTSGWALRDKIVAARDELFETEMAWADLADRAHEIVSAGLPREALDEMLTVLDQISPDSRDAEQSVYAKLLIDLDFQRQVAGELTALLNAPPPQRVPSETDEELLTLAEKQTVELIEASGLTDLALTRLKLDADLADIEAALADQGVNMLSTIDRQHQLGIQAELKVERARLLAEWERSPPDLAAAKALRDTLDALIRRRMFDLGLRAALFGHRYDQLLADSQLHTMTPGTLWNYIVEMRDLVSALDAARPIPSPLAGLQLKSSDPDAPPPTAAELIKAGTLPKPKPGGGKKGKGGGKP